MKTIAKNFFPLSLKYFLAVIFGLVLFVSVGCGIGNQAVVSLNLGGFGTARTISDSQKDSAVFDIFFNDVKVADKTKGVFSWAVTAGSTVMVRVEAFAGEELIAIGEKTVLVVAGENNVQIVLREVSVSGQTSTDNTADVPDVDTPKTSITIYVISGIVYRSGMNDIVNDGSGNYPEEEYEIDLEADDSAYMFTNPLASITTEYSGKQMIGLVEKGSGGPTGGVITAPDASMDGKIYYRAYEIK